MAYHATAFVLDISIQISHVCGPDIDVDGEIDHQGGVLQGMVINHSDHLACFDRRVELRCLLEVDEANLRIWCNDVLNFRRSLEAPAIQRKLNLQSSEQASNLVSCHV